MNTKSFAALDFEHLTSNQHTACSVGLVIVKNNVIVQEYYSLINPPEDDGYESGKSGITRDMCRDAPLFPEVWKTASEMIGNLPIVAHNCPTERTVIDKACAHFGVDDNSGRYEFIDTYKITGSNLNDSCREYSISLGEHHNALCDARACAELYMKMENSNLVIPTPKKDIPHISRRSKEKWKMRDAMKQSNEDIFTPLPPEDVVYKDTIFFGNRVLVTGEFERFPHREISLYGLLKKMGATVEKSGSYVKRIDILLVGNKKAGESKQEKAEADRKLIIRENEFYKLLELKGIDEKE